MTETFTANLCLLLTCCVWPSLWAFVAFNVGRHGARGWARQVVIRMKQFGYQEGASP